MPDLFLCHFAGLQYTEHYWSLSPDARQQRADNLSAEQRHEIEAIEARRAKIRELARKPLESEEDA